MLPFDVLRLISLKLNPHTLSINKELHNMYDDTWYQDKITLLEPNMNLFSTNYKDLYKKYINQGYIFSFKGRKFVTKGIKICPTIEEDDYWILTFNGNLICESNSKVLIIDQNVVDMDCDTYVKDYEWYVYFDCDEEKSKLDITPTSPFRKVLSHPNMYYALTYDGIYYLYEGEVQFLPIEGAIDMYLADQLYVLDDKGITHVVDYNYENDFELIETDNKYQLQLDTVLRKNKSLYLMEDHIPFEVKFPGSDKFDKVCWSGKEIIFKVQDVVYVYKYNTRKILSFKKSIKNVKNIFEGYNAEWFYIM